LEAWLNAGLFYVHSNKSASWMRRLENQLTMNTESLLKIVKEVRNKTPVRVDHLLAPFLIKELLKEKS
jgi:hypothetical protein